MKIYLYHGQGNTIWPTSWPAVLWGQMPVWDETSLFAARELSSTPMLFTRVKTDGQEETRLGILRPYKVLQWRVLNYLMQKAV